ncbi:MAG: dimethylsulfoniopropionate demethylase [Aestuariivita sp.]|nr:dimethylsulfoniopropionate demethylase [Aestuariivita sp.]
MTLISPACRLRRTPFSEGVEAAGVRAYSVYNRMLLPSVFQTLEADYRHLKKHVQVWDVACERQVEMCGPDTARLMDLLTPRDLNNMQIGQCCYVPIVNDVGGMLNDPVAIKLGDDRWWLSIADSDLLLWVRGIVIGFGLDVCVFEPDVSPLAVQGPKAGRLMERVFGPEVHSIPFFRSAMCAFSGQQFMVARSGFSKQGGFEIYVEDSSIGMSLWTALFDAGEDLEVRAGCPNTIERIEGGLLSYGSDMTSCNNPYECRLGRYCNKPPHIEHIGRTALTEIAREGPVRQIRAVEIFGDPISVCDRPWPIVVGRRRVGQITSAVWSPDYEVNVSIGMIEREFWLSDTAVQVDTQNGLRDARIKSEFWA